MAVVLGLIVAGYLIYYMATDPYMLQDCGYDECF